MSTSEIDSQTFLTLLNITVEKHECKIKNIDFENYIIDIKGSTENQKNCALEIAEIFDKYLI